jgi:carbohydrate diacid regulator
MTGQFEQIVATVTERVAETLGTATYVLDEREVIIASSDEHAVGSSLARVLETRDDVVRVPVRVGPHMGDLVVAALSGTEVISPRLARMLVEMIVNQTVLVARMPDQHALRNEFVLNLLRGTIQDEAEVIREGQILGMDLTLPRAVILIDAADFILHGEQVGRPEEDEAQIRRRAQMIIASVVNFFHLPSDTICAYIGRGEVAVLKASTTQDLFAWADDGSGLSGEEWSASWANLSALKRAGKALLCRLRHDISSSVSIGIGRYHPGIRGLAHSYQDALAALSLGQRIHGPNQLHCLDGLGTAAFVGVADERTKIDLARHLLSPLDHEPELLDTLEAFFAEHLSPSNTANRLSIHRNTLAYRLDKITGLVGLDPRHFDEAVQFHLAMLLRSFQSLTC